MEDPEQEIEGVIRSLVCKPSLDRLEEVLQRFFAPDCSFYHLYVNIKGENSGAYGVEGLKSIYQVAEMFFNYQDVEFHHILHDAAKNLLAVRMSLWLRPWIKLGLPMSLELFTLLELEDFQSEDGRDLKRIKVQRDYFQRSPVLQMIPILGDLYSSDFWKSWFGNMEASLFTMIRNLINSFRS